jgi:hypothetical protein
VAFGHEGIPSAFHSFSMAVGETAMQVLFKILWSCGRCGRLLVKGGKYLAHVAKGIHMGCHHGI